MFFLLLAATVVHFVHVADIVIVAQSIRRTDNHNQLAISKRKAFVSQVGTCLRLSLGEPLFGLPSLVSTPKHATGDSEVLPVKTMVMCASLATLLTASWISRRRRIPSDPDAKQEQYSLSD